MQTDRVPIPSLAESKSIDQHRTMMEVVDEASLNNLLNEIADYFLTNDSTPESEFEIRYATRRPWLDASLKELHLMGFAERSRGNIELTPFGLQVATAPSAQKARNVAESLLEYIKSRASAEGQHFGSMVGRILSMARPQWSTGTRTSESFAVLAPCSGCRTAEQYLRAQAVQSLVGGMYPELPPENRTV